LKSKYDLEGREFLLPLSLKHLAFRSYCLKAYIQVRKFIILHLCCMGRDTKWFPYTRTLAWRQLCRELSLTLSSFVWLKSLRLNNKSPVEPAINLSLLMFSLHAAEGDSFCTCMEIAGYTKEYRGRYGLDLVSTFYLYLSLIVSGVNLLETKA